jgi:hypothetical protein
LPDYPADAKANNSEGTVILIPKALLDRAAAETEIEIIFTLPDSVVGS